MPYMLNQSAVEFRDRPLLFIDLEFTGLDVSRHEIIEAAALLVRPPDFNIADSYYTKVQPQHIATADPEALKIINYRPDLWREAIPLRQLLQELSQLAPNCILAGWSVQNDWDFLNTALERENLPYFFDHRLLEVFSLAYTRLFKDSRLTHLSLANTAKLLDISLQRHQPDSDIRATYEIFRRLSGL